MNPATAEFVELCIANQVLRFGEFTLKSGRISPYFFDTGLCSRGPVLSQLAEHYARLLAEKLECDFMLYGPAYKGIALAAATTMKLADQYNRNIGYVFHRKETKSHGEGGSLVGETLRGKVVIIDDVITAGTSICHAMAAIKSAGATPHSVIIALDRQEIADNQTLSAVQYVEKHYGIAVNPLITLHDLIEYLAQTTYAKHLAAIQAYRAQYGVS